ncbi:5-oxoprolinase subunit PxpB [Porticoccus litoralis]|uniref:5-oxoprolinase subunit PxpB n=1 Tax=Porticoccus litoralis TaxID=434086 RepID=A0AAW8B348_9GAMM|nr:5-oxoprolinase subunit PxpB [Porticoccus litoralis]MDP1519538.1 5-oxoprolinase subunit PxpB [Porticoccus litoralis]TNE93551.1 MAG: 5-oxoprolinase subunit PxpB [Gammaproteobacteria bacterium]
MKIAVAGENALIIYLSDHLSPEVSDQVQRAVQVLEQALGDLLVDLVPSYASLLLIYDLYKTDYGRLCSQIPALLAEAKGRASERRAKLVELPVYYSEESGPDLRVMASQTGLSISDIVDLHQAREYRVYAIGFAPGFAYLGEVDERIAHPRLATPRPRVRQGSVGIAGRQTAVYPSISPGGWNLIGRCPLLMFDLQADPPMPVEVGDRVRFFAIDRSEFISMGGEL